MYNAEEPKNVISKCLKYFLFAFNLFYWRNDTLGNDMWYEMGKHPPRQISVIIKTKAELSELDKEAEAIGGVMLGIGIWSITQKSSYKELSSIATDPAVILVTVGCLIIIISFFGTVGALRENICLLETYKWMMVIIVILEILGGLLAFAFWPEVRDSIETQIKKGIVNYRDDIDLQNVIDGIQEKFKCCGSSNVNDWNINQYFKCNGPSPEECGVPHSCCVKTEGQSINVQCGWNVRHKHRLLLAKEKKIYIVGCLDAVIIWFRDHLYVVGALAIAFAFPQFLGIILTHIFVGQIKEQIAECSKPPMYKYRPDRTPLTSDYSQ